MKIKLFLLTVLCIVCASCSNEGDDIFAYNSGLYSDSKTRSLYNSEDKDKMYKIIEKYHLVPVDPSEYSQIDIENLAPITSAEQLESILSKVNIVEYHSLLNIDTTKISRLKTRSESGFGQNVVSISGTNSNGSATVYVDLNGPSVVGSSVKLGFIDAFLDYRHISGRAYRYENEINFTAYGEGWVKLIFEGIELFKYTTSIEGICNSDGTDGRLTKF